MSSGKIRRGGRMRVRERAIPGALRREPDGAFPWRTAGCRAKPPHPWAGHAAKCSPDHQHAGRRKRAAPISFWIVARNPTFVSSPKRRGGPAGEGGRGGPEEEHAPTRGEDREEIEGD